MDRRTFVTGTALSSMGLFFGSEFTQGGGQKGFDFSKQGSSGPDIMKEVLKYRKIDSHAHVYFSPDSPAAQLDYAERLGITKVMISKNLEPFSVGTPEEFRRANDLAIKCMKDHPDRFIATMVLNPVFQKESLEEIKRCVDAGMVGAGELYNQLKINDPLYYPIIEKFIDLKMVILMHSAIGKSRVILNEGEPKNISLPEEFVEVAKRYPEAMIQFAHIGGGIDWEYACKTLANSPSIYVDISGSNNEEGMIDFALKYIGEDRLLFGCDESYYQGVGHMFGDNLTDAQRKKIFFDNYNNILKKSGNNVD